MSIIYHYCSVDTFLKIIKTRSLRFSDITKSNDSQEIVWVLNFMQSALRAEYDKQSDAFKSQCPFDKIIQRKSKHFLNRYWNEYSLLTFFACCFSKEKDSVNMWRAYADGGKGIAIGFRDDFFQALQGDCECIQYSEMQYTKDSEILQKETTELFGRLNNAMRSGEIMDFYNQPYDGYMKSIFRKAAFCKHPCFQEEKETRACIQWNLKHSNPSGNSLYCGKNTIASMELKQETVADNFKLFIDVTFDFPAWKHMLAEIMIGPKCECKKKDILAFLQLNGFDTSSFDSIEYSECPYI